MSDPTNTKTQSKLQIERLLARSVLYQMLAFFFRYPEVTRDLSAVKENVSIWRDAVKELFSINGGGDVEAALEDLLTAFQTLSIREWRMDYEKNLGHTAHSGVPAYELEYGEAHSKREPQELADIAGFYNAFGLKVSDKLPERGDHVSVECEFLHFLLYKESVALEDGAQDKAEICRDASFRFFSEHLGYWLPTFSKRLSKNSVGFMKKVAVLAYEFVSQDCRVLGIEPGPEGLPVRVVKENEDSGCVSCVVGSANPATSEGNHERPCQI